MNLDRRAARVEQKMGVAGPCPVCHGRGAGSLVVSYDGEPVVRPACPACGAMAGSMTVVIVNGPRPDGAGQGARP